MTNNNPAGIQPWRDVRGMRFAIASDLTSAMAANLDPTDQSPLARAIRETFPDANPAYWHMIGRRFREFYKDITEKEAVVAVLKGYSSPVDAMSDRVIRRRTFLGSEYRRAYPIGFNTWVLNVAWITNDAAGWFIEKMQTIFAANPGPAHPIAKLESLLDFVRERGGDQSVLDAAKDAWRRYQLWAGVQS